MPASSALSHIHMQIMWNRLIAVVEEQARTLMRTAFSTTVRESGDLSAGVFDTRGRMLAQAVTGTPGHVNAMAMAVQHFLDKYPVARMEAGDHYLSNDPWLMTGHLHDITVVSPVFRGGKCAALFASTCHVVDIGGRGFGPDARQVYEEGLYLPILPLVRRGQVNETLIEIVRWNVRTPVQVEGDIFSLVASNEEGARRLLDMMNEFRIEEIDTLGSYIVDSARRAMLEEIGRLPRGTYRNRLISDGYDQPVELVAALTIAEDGISVDLAGTSPASGFGINVPMAYTLAYCSFGIRCVVGPAIPNNAGSLEPIRVSAPEGCILNAQRPWPVAARHVIGHLLPDLVLGCLHQAIPDRVPAEGASTVWEPQLRGGPSTVGFAPGSNATTPDFDVITFNSGGTGARPGKDGLSATAFPSGVRTVPVEITETVAPVIVWRKELRPDSGGAGRFRGGLGQVFELGAENDAPFVVLAMFDRCHNPPWGRQGGREGTAGQLLLKEARTALKPKGEQLVPAGEHLLLELPGGGGLGDPFERAPDSVLRDVRDGYVSRDKARELYGVVIDAQGRLDEVATRAIRLAHRAA